MHIDKMTLEELKILAYDQIQLFNVTQSNIRVIEEMIIKRNSEIEIKDS